MTLYDPPLNLKYSRQVFNWNKHTVRNSLDIRDYLISDTLMHQKSSLDVNIRNRSSNKFKLSCQQVNWWRRITLLVTTIKVFKIRSRSRFSFYKNWRRVKFPANCLVCGLYMIRLNLVNSIFSACRESAKMLWQLTSAKRLTVVTHRLGRKKS